MSKKFSVLIKKKIKKFNQTIMVESDKSISHRALLISSQCIGKSVLNVILESSDVKNTITCLKDLGVKIIKKNNNNRNFRLDLYDPIFITILYLFIF